MLAGNLCSAEQSSSAEEGLYSQCGGSRSGNSDEQ